MRIVRRIDENKPAQTASLGIVGHIRIGEKQAGQNGVERPVSLDYFKADAPEQYVQFFRAAYGEKPAKLTITFLSNNMDECCRQFYELRDGSGGRVAYGDGQTFYVATKQGDNTVKDVVHTPADPSKWMNEIEAKIQEAWPKVKTKWRERLVLRFAIPQIPVLGLWEFSTHGNNSTIPGIISTIDLVYEMAGRLAGIPFDLMIEKVKSDKAGSKSVYPVVSLVCNISQESAAIVRNLPVHLGAMLTEQKILELASSEQPALPQGPAKEPEVFTDYEEVKEPDLIDIEVLRDKVGKCLSGDALKVLFESDKRYNAEPYKPLFTKQKEEIKRLTQNGQIQP